MRGNALVSGLLAAAAAVAASALAGEPVGFHSPGFPPSSMDAQGRLVEDGTFENLLAQRRLFHYLYTMATSTNSQNISFDAASFA